MKRKWLGLALAAVMACAGAATATEYTDSSANYPEGWESGSNGGEGFMPWKIASNSGSGWAGGGIWPTADAGVSGDVVDANGKAFGIIGKGDGSSFTASRNFRAALAVGDSFEFDMAVNWDCGSDENSKKGIALLLGSEDAIVINHDHFPGPMSVNGFTDDPALQNYGTGTMHWTIVAKDATNVTVTGTARDGESEPYSADITLSSSALTGFRLQSALQTTEDSSQEDADKRQSYFNNFKLNIAGELPDIVTLEFTSGEWAVESASQTLAYTLTRSSSAGALDVAVSSSDEAFVAGTTVSFADGETSKDFTLAATLTGSGNFALITANAPGCDAANSYEVKGPGFDCTAEGGDAPWTLAPEETRTLKVKNTQPWGVHGDNSLVTVASQDEKIVTVSALGAWADDEASCTVTGVGGGWAPVEVFYAGVKMAEYGFTVVPPGATLSGPTSLRVGNEATYTLAVTLAGDIESDTFQLVADNEDLVSIDPAEAQELTESGTLEFKVTALKEGDVTLSVIDDKGLDADIAPITVSITEAPDYSDYVAYDDASLYDLGDLNYASVGEGTDKFLPWDEVYKNADGESTFAGAVVVTAAPDPSALTEGQAFALYANGADGAEIQLRRQFANPLDNGQAFSVVVSPNYRDGTKGVKFMGVWEGEWYPRAEFFYNNDGYFYKLDGDEDATNLGWEYATDAITITLKKAADGSSYTLTFARGDEVVAKEGITSFQGTVDCAQFYSWQGGNGDENNLVFNSLAIQQVEEPVVERAIGWAVGVWNPDAAGEYKFAISATTDDIGEVALTVEPSDGALSLSTASVDLTGKLEESFAVILSEANEGDSFVIKATPADTTVDPIEYNVTVVSSHVTLSSDAWEYPVSAGEIWLALTASVSKYGTYAITSSDEAVLAVPEASEAITVGSPDPSWFNVAIVGPGKATIYATAEGEETPAAEYTFTVIADAPVIDGTTIEVSFADGDGLSGKVDDALRDQFTDVKAQVLQWNGVDAFDEVEVLNNEAEWPDMQFTPSIDNPVIRFIFVK